MQEISELELLAVKYLFSLLVQDGTEPMEAVTRVLAVWLNDAEKEEMTRLLLGVITDGVATLSPDDMYVLAQTARANVKENL